MENEVKNGLKKISENYANATDLELLYIDMSTINEFFTEPRCSFCRAVSSNKTGRQACSNQRRIFAMDALSTYAPAIKICPAGLAVWSIPVYYHAELTGLLLSGFAVSVNESDSNLLAQIGSFRKLFGIPEGDVKKYYPIINKIDPHRIEPLANLLFSLTRTFIDSGLSVNEQIKIPSHLDIIPFNSDRETELSLYDKPFSFYLSDNLMSGENLNFFWKIFETRTTDIFINIIGGRLIDARSLFTDIMSMAYREKTTDQAKVSSIHIYHIMTMKFFSKKFFDIRMYNLLNDTIKDLMHASDLNDIRNIMDTTFTKMCNIHYIKPKEIQRSFTGIVIQYIEENYRKRITVSEIAERLHVSAAHLSRTFKNETGFTIKWCITTIRMSHAQELLIHTETPVNKIAESVGYDDMRAFYKMFSKQFGITPTELRNRYSGLTAPSSV